MLEEIDDETLAAFAEGRLTKPEYDTVTQKLLSQNTARAAFRDLYPHEYRKWENGNWNNQYPLTQY